MRGRAQVSGDCGTLSPGPCPAVPTDGAQSGQAVGLPVA